MTTRVLIVDDEPLARDTVRLVLSADPDVAVVGACSGIDAAAQIAATSPDVVFLDVQMPGVDGFEVIDQVGLAAMPAVVFVTAYDEHAVRAFEVHAIDYVLKPYDDRRLLAALARVRQLGEPVERPRHDEVADGGDVGIRRHAHRVHRRVPAREGGPARRPRSHDVVRCGRGAAQDRTEGPRHARPPVRRQRPLHHHRGRLRRHRRRAAPHRASVRPARGRSDGALHGVPLDARALPATQYRYWNPTLDERGRQLQSADAMLEEKRVPEAIALLEKLAATDTDGSTWLTLGNAKFGAGDRKGAAAAYARVGEKSASYKKAVYNLACSYALLGDKPRAIAALGKAIAAGIPKSYAMADSDLAAIKTEIATL